MEYTLHKLPQGFILTSDETPKKDDIVINNLDSLIGKSTRELNQGEIKDKEYSKVIAQQDQIDFSNLTEEEQKEIGWFDSKSESIPFINSSDMRDGKEIKTWMNGWEQGHIEGFQKAQELLSDKRFTLKDFHKFLDLHTDSAPIEYLKREATKFLSQPKSWKVELEMDFVHTDHVEGGFEYFPKLTNEKVKLLKLLNK
jgi:hypothetical protein